MLKKIIKNVFEKEFHVKNEECPEPEILAAYIDNSITKEDKGKIEKHLAFCAFCFEQIIISSASEKLEKNVKPVKERPDIIISFLKNTVEVIKTIGDELVFFPDPALIPARGKNISSSNSAKFMRNFKEILSEFEVERFSNNKYEIRIKITKNQSPLDNIRVMILCDAKEIESCLTKHGRVLFEDIGPGNYSIKLKMSGRLIGVLTLTIQ